MDRPVKTVRAGLLLAAVLGGPAASLAQTSSQATQHPDRGADSLRPARNGVIAPAERSTDPRMPVVRPALPGRTPVIRPPDRTQGGSVVVPR